MRRFSQPRPIDNNERTDGASSRRGNASYWRRRAVVFAALIAMGCGSRGPSQGRVEPASDAACRSVDSSLGVSGWRDSVVMSGKVKIDVKQYRVTGRFRMTSTAAGDVTFQFTGTMVFGGHHEDVVVSFHQGELRILDRERARFYEGVEADEMVRGGLDVDWNLSELIRRITAQSLDCDRLSSLVVSRGTDNAKLKGRYEGEDIELAFAGGRLVRGSWPVTSNRGLEDRMNVTYRWDRSGALKELIVYFEAKRWRFKLDAD